MEVGQQPYFHKDPPSECRSFGSNYWACSQPRKISRGVLIDSSAKLGSKNANKEVPIQSEEYLTPSKAAEVGNSVEGVNSTDSGKHPRTFVQDTFPTLSTRSLYQKIPISESEAVHGPTESNCNKNSQRQFDSMIIARKDSNAVAMEKLASSKAQEVDVEDTTKKAETKGCETLRMKLWEILGTVASPKQHLNDYDLKVGAKDLESPQRKDAEHNLAIKSKQNSDTIESDSEFPNDTVRIMAHSLSKKQASNKLTLNRTTNAQYTYYKDIEGKNTTCVREGFSGRISHGICGGSLKQNKSKKQGSSTGACKTFSPDQGNQVENEWMKNQKEVKPPGKRSISHGNGGGRHKEFCSTRKTELMEPKSAAVQRDPHQSPLINLSDKPRSLIDSPKLQENGVCKEDVGFLFLKSTTNEKVENPTFEMRTPTKISFPGFLPTEIKTPTESFSDGSLSKKQPGGPDDCSPSGMIFNKKGIQCFKSWLDCKSNSQINYSVDAGENDDSPTVNPGPTVEEEPGTRMSRSSSPDSDSVNSEEDSHVKGCTEPDSHFPEIFNAEKSTNVLHLNKKRRYLDGTNISGFSPILTSRAGVKDHSKFQQHLELKQDNGLPREVALFALTLKGFKSKMDLVVRKRSTEILTSVAEKISLQLQNAEYQMQADAGKLTNHSKSKRKHLEMRYQELQGNLKAMHERFKEDLNQHIQLCKSTVEGLEAQQMELKVAAEKQRASNRKLLLQAKAAIETELSDAQRKVTTVQNSARRKMLQLKNMLADSLKEGNFN